MFINAKLVGQIGFESKEAYLSSLSSITLFGLYILIFILFDRYAALQQSVQKERLAYGYASKEHAYYEKLERQQEEIRKLSHDMKNHLMLMEGMSVDNQRKCYAQKLYEELKLREQYTDTENGIADIIFFEKQSDAKEHEVELVLSVEQGILKDYDEIELCTILSKAMDNGNEACKMFHGRLTVKGMKTSFGVVLTFENPLNEETYQNLKEKDLCGRYSSKGDAQNHGMGIGNIERSVEKLSGSMSIQIKENSFLLSIILPLGS